MRPGGRRLRRGGPATGRKAWCAYPDTLFYGAMWLILFFVLQAAAAPTLDFAVFKTKIEPLLLEKRPGHARCYVCHSTGTAFRLQALSPGAKTWTEAQSQKNF